MKTIANAALLFWSLGAASTTHAQVSPPGSSTQNVVPRLSALAKMPVREITVFKDGHAWVLHEGAMPVDAQGNVTLDYLPTPVLGTFWPYAAGQNVRLQAVTASPRRTLVDRTALTLRDLLEANIGARVLVTEINDGQKAEERRYEAKILAMPQRSAAELQQTDAATDTERLPQKSDLIWLQTGNGTRVIGINQIRDVTFPDAPRPMLGHEEFRNLLTLKLDWNGKPVAPTANIGLSYLQRGVRWIPSYKVTLDNYKIKDKSQSTRTGRARVQLQATILNELTDFQNVTAHLVIGVPSFAFKDSLDPIGLQNTLAQLSQFFQDGDRSNRALGNNIQAQVTSAYFRAPTQATEARDLGPEIGGSEKAEDLFLFSVRNLSLKRGERMTMPVVEGSVPYKDIYTLDIPFAPPAEALRNYNANNNPELAKLLEAPKVLHKIRLTNSTTQPFTTAPVLLMQNERILSQGMMTYTAPGGQGDLTLTTAVDVQVKKSDVETSRVPNAVKWQDYSYGRVNLAGKIALCNYSDETIELEVTRGVLGEVDTAAQKGAIEKINTFEAARMMPNWSNYGDWSSWWSQVNGIGRITWKVRLEPRKEIELPYTWHYFWR